MKFLILILILVSQQPARNGDHRIIPLKTEQEAALKVLEYNKSVPQPEYWTAELYEVDLSAKTIEKKLLPVVKFEVPTPAKEGD